MFMLYCYTVYIWNSKFVLSNILKIVYWLNLFWWQSHKYVRFLKHVLSLAHRTLKTNNLNIFFPLKIQQYCNITFLSHQTRRKDHWNPHRIGARKVAQVSNAVMQRSLQAPMEPENCAEHWWFFVVFIYIIYKYREVHHSTKKYLIVTIQLFVYIIFEPFPT
jgi:hypothetical protein